MPDVVEATPGIHLDELRRRLHDGVLQTLEFMTTGGWGTLRDTHEFRQLARHASEELRAVIEGEDLPATLGSAVRDYCSRARRLGPPVSVDVDVEDGCEQLPAAAADAALRAMGEAVTNAVQHACASRIHVTACRRGDALVLRVADDGRGCPGGAIEQGYGVRRSIVERVLEAGGSVRIEEGLDGSGTCVHLETAAELPAPARGCARRTR